jgi:hypothetical protein
MSLVIAAAGAAVTALIQISNLSFAPVGGVSLDLLLVAAIVWTMTVSLEGGLVWAFLGGLIIDILLDWPIGLTSFVLLLAVGAAWIVGRLTPRALYPGLVVSAAVLGAATQMLRVLLFGAFRGLPAGIDLVGPAVSSGVLAGIAAAVLGAVAMLARRRFAKTDVDRLDW